MARTFPDDPMLRGVHAPVFVEGESGDLPIAGELPPGLDGTLYRNGPNPQFAPRGHYHWFAGDGMVHAFQFENGRVRYRNRWVRTPKFQLERAAGTALFGSFGDPSKSDPSVHGKDFGLANTHIIQHGGRLLALEESHLPFELDPRTLESRGYHDFDGRLPTTIQGRFTAHPKIDPVTGEMVGYSYSGSGLFGTRMSLIVVAADGRLTRQDAFEAPYCSFVHDFMLTREHVVFPILPLSGSTVRARAGGPAYAWEPEKPALLGVVGRDAPIDSMRWFQVEPCYVFHIFNAWTEGTRVVCDVMRFDRPPHFPDASGRPPAANTNLGRPVRWTIDLGADTDRVREELLNDAAGEFPRCDERITGAPYRHGWYSVTDPARRAAGSAFTGVGHLDHATGTRREFDVPEGDALSEAVFVPRTADAAEGDGYLLALQYLGRDNLSELLVLDAQEVDRGPLARVILNTRIPAGFHGSWVAA